MAERLAGARDERDDKAEQHRGEHQHPKPAQEGVAPAPTPRAVSEALLVGVAQIPGGAARIIDQQRIAAQAQH